jgi:hypothetical protein
MCGARDFFSLLITATCISLQDLRGNYTYKFLNDLRGLGTVNEIIACAPDSSPVSR